MGRVGSLLILHRDTGGLVGPEPSVFGVAEMIRLNRAWQMIVSVPVIQQKKDPMTEIAEETVGIHPMHKPPEKMGVLARDMVEFLSHRGLGVFLIETPTCLIKGKAYAAIAKKVRGFSDFAEFVKDHREQDRRVGLYDVNTLESVEGPGGLWVRYVIEGQGAMGVQEG